jgi:hypothetical protein
MPPGLSLWRGLLDVAEKADASAVGWSVGTVGAVGPPVALPLPVARGAIAKTRCLESWPPKRRVLLGELAS